MAAFAGYVGSSLDVTEQKQAAQGLERSRDRLQAENLYLRCEVCDQPSAGAIAGQRSHPPRPGPGRAGSCHRLDGTAVRETGMERARRDAYSRPERAARKADGARQVRDHSCHTDRERVVRSRRARSPGRWRGRLDASSSQNHSTIFLDEIGDLPADVQVESNRRDLRGEYGRTAAVFVAWQHSANCEMSWSAP